MATTKYVWVGENVLYETDGADAVTVTYTYAPEGYGNLLSEQRGGVTYTHHYDAQGSTLALTDDTGVVTDTFRYTAWGEEVVRTGTTPTPFRWIGEKGYYWNESAGRYDVRRRTYGPATARWLTADPIGLADGLNRFAYVRNRPIRFVDPSGFLTLEADPQRCIANVRFSISVTFVRLHAGLQDDPYFPTYAPGYQFPLGGGESITRQDWTARRQQSFLEQFPKVVEGCWNKSHQFKIFPGTLYFPSNACICPCRSGWTPKVTIVVNRGTPDILMDVMPNYPFDSTVRDPVSGKDMNIPSWVDRPFAYLDEADLIEQSERVPTDPEETEGIPPEFRGKTYRQATACHEFGHMIGLVGHPGSDKFSDDRVYWYDAPALMGIGSEFRRNYFGMWEGELDKNFPQCVNHSTR